MLEGNAGRLPREGKTAFLGSTQVYPKAGIRAKIAHQRGWPFFQAMVWPGMNEEGGGGSL